ncbi:MAG: hypothetical protein TH68_03190 [Candidatus Synechococcus spongiarum 142]|uniref:Uncharacterized protein n=1 Tax=Candidatus Synechococcus spongiarum 142 TaxID=1608213 RepID=A0A6N3X978_9SYNE|nr:MAG: hypothetical protein TH68_03190 [Candidatus Synechococcus spongiarum 142]
MIPINHHHSVHGCVTHGLQGGVLWQVVHQQAHADTQVKNEVNGGAGASVAILKLQEFLP